MNKTETIHLINDLASRGIPFIFVISFDGNENIVSTLDAAAERGIYIDIPAYRNHTFSPEKKSFLDFKAFPVGPEEYKSAFEKVMGEIKYGNTFLLNLTFPSKIESNYTLSEIFCHAHAKFKLMLDGKFVVFSPERFVKIENGVITSNPMKGTIDAALPNAHMLLKSDRKEDAEHNTIVDLIRNDLGIVAKDIRVKRFKYIEKIKTHNRELLQMSSEISGKLKQNIDRDLGDMLFKLLPAGSVSGAPKPKTIEIINKSETYKRGFYTGVFGYFDGKMLDSSVIIRYIEQEENQLIFKSGGGITHMSKWENEYREMINKIYVPIY